MKSLAVFVGLLILALGLAGIVAPGVLVNLGQYSTTLGGLYVVGALRIVIGLVLLGASSASRTPKTLRVCGVVALAAGITTPILGVERAHAIMNWSVSHPLVVRLWGVAAVALACFATHAVVSRVSSRGDRLQNRPGTWFTQRVGK